MQNQENKDYQQKLGEFRSEINAIDDEILNLLKKRMEIVAKVRQVKEQNHENFFIKPAREADMIKNLVAKAPNSMTKSAIVSIWRKIITSSNMFEQPLKIAICNPSKNTLFEHFIQDYYADFVPIINHDSINNAILELEKNNAQITVFALPCDNQDLNENWWINVANNKSGIKVFAKLPFLKQDKNNLGLVALAIKKQEKSSSDETLLYVETDSEISRAQILSTLKSNGIEGKILKSTKVKEVNNITFSLIELQNYFDEESPEIKAFAASKIKPFVKVLGCYATQI